METSLKELVLDPAVPTWAKVLINCVNSFMEERGKSQALLPRVSQLEEKFGKLEEEHRLMKIQMAGLRDEIDALEQYSRRNCLIFHGIPEEKGESTSEAVMDVIRNQLNISDQQVNIKEIDRSHRLGKPKSTRETRSNKRPSRPIIVKFKGYDARGEVFSKEKNPQGIKHHDNGKPYRSAI